MHTSAHLALPDLQPNQAQKQVMPNEALSILEAVSCLFQSNDSGHARIRLISGDDLTFKVSSDGIGYSTALTLNADMDFAGRGSDALPLHFRQDYYTASRWIQSKAAQAAVSTFSTRPTGRTGA